MAEPRRLAKMVLFLVACALVVVGCDWSWLRRVNVASDGTEVFSQPTFTGGFPSADGRYVAFQSTDPNLVPGDTNGVGDVFVRDNLTGTTERVSIADDESQGEAIYGVGGDPAMSADGRYVVFTAAFDNLVPGDTNDTSDVFLRDRVEGTTERISITSGEVQTGGGGGGRVSADGRFVVFTSSADDIVPGDTNGDPPCPHIDPFCEQQGSDVFVRDRVAGTTERVSVASDGSQGDNGSSHTELSADGRYVTFTSLASNFASGDLPETADVFVRDRVAGTTELVSETPDGDVAANWSMGLDASPDAQFILFMSTSPEFIPGDEPNTRDIFVLDRSTGAIEQVNLKTDGTRGERDPDPEGSISGDGRFVVFTSWASDLVPGDTNGAGDIFLRDRRHATLDRVSLDGFQGEAADESPPAALAVSMRPRLSDDGRYVTFSSQADNLVPDDTNGVVTDVFVRFAVRPVVGSIDPAVVGPGTTRVTIHGRRFLPGATGSVGGTGVSSVLVDHPDDTTLIVDVTVAPGTPAGRLLVEVKNAGTGPGVGTGSTDTCGCLAVP